MLYVNAMNATVRNAGTDTDTSFQSISVTQPIIRTPTYTRAAAVAHPGINAATGLKNIAIKKIPKMLFGRCEFDKNNYNLNIISLPEINECEENED